MKTRCDFLASSETGSKVIPLKKIVFQDHVKTLFVVLYLHWLIHACKLSYDILVIKNDEREGKPDLSSEFLETECQITFLQAGELETRISKLFNNFNRARTEARFLCHNDRLQYMLRPSTLCKQYTASIMDVK